jgi:hypothetical protein
MRYRVLAHDTRFTGPAGRVDRIRKSYQVVDVEAGLTGRNWPKRVIAHCADEADAERIARVYNADRHLAPKLVDELNEERALRRLIEKQRDEYAEDRRVFLARLNMKIYCAIEQADATAATGPI